MQTTGESNQLEQAKMSTCALKKASDTWGGFASKTDMSPFVDAGEFK